MEQRYVIAMVAGIVVVIAAALAVVWKTAPTPTVQQASQTPTRPAPLPAEPPAREPVDRNPTAAPNAPRGAPKRTPLQDIADPLEAVEILHLRRGEGDTIELRARNRSKRGVFVKSVDLFAESDELVPLDNVGFWLPVGGLAESRREVPELSRRLGDNEAIKAVINEAEFRDSPPEELAK
jgi:hypothetical protein